LRASGLIRAGQFNQAVRQGTFIVIALALPRLGVPREQIGQWETLLFVGYLLGFGWTSGLLQGFLVRMGRLNDAAGRKLAAGAVGVVFLFSAILLLLTAAGHDWVFAALRLRSAPLGWPFFFLLLLARWPSYCFEQALLLLGHVRSLLVYTCLNAAGLLGAVLLPLYLGYDLLTSMRVLGAYAGAKSILIGICTYLSFRPPPSSSASALASTSASSSASALASIPSSPSPLRPWLITSLPLIAYATVATLVTTVDPWVVNYWYEGDPEVFAIFRYGVRELPFLAALISGMTVVAIPHIGREASAGLPLLRDQSRKLYHLVFALALGLLLTSGWWWTLVFTKTFAPSLPLFRTYLLVVGCRLVFAMTVLTAFDITKRLYLWGALELIVNLVLSLLLVPRYGLQGVIWGTVIASYFHELCLVVYLRYRTGTDWREYADLRWYFGYLVLLFAVYLFLLPE
jgi:O-antigen/teichoic acid export membrane protein